MGLFAAYLPKPYGTAEIFTAQGSKKQIQTILPLLLEYLEKAGGAVDCSIKEERVADWWMSHPDLRLPPVIASIGHGARPVSGWRGHRSGGLKGWIARLVLEAARRR
jgi:hypothetical protein